MAVIQAPSAVYAYFLKCRTEDAIQIGQLLLREQCPKYHRIEGAPFSLLGLMTGIHLRAGWPDRDLAIERFAMALRSMLGDYVNEHHRWEYNSIKHGLRTSHGRFALAAGIQEAPNIPAPPEAMQVIGASRDASFFSVVRPLANATNQQSKINFKTERVSLSWSLEKVLMELQILSFLIHNTASAIQVAPGVESGTVTFNKGAEDEQFWELYSQIDACGVRNASFGYVIDAREIDLATEKSVISSYKRRAPNA
ncbi:hypothetical protein ACFQFS_16925 [Novosphingobium lubricantis]